MIIIVVKDEKKTKQIDKKKKQFESMSLIKNFDSNPATLNSQHQLCISIFNTLLEKTWTYILCTLSLVYINTPFIVPIHEEIE